MSASVPGTAQFRGQGVPPPDFAFGALKPFKIMSRSVVMLCAGHFGLATSFYPNLLRGFEQCPCAASTEVMNS